MFTLPKVAPKGRKKSSSEKHGNLSCMDSDAFLAPNVSLFTTSRYLRTYNTQKLCLLKSYVCLMTEKESKVQQWDSL